VFKVSGCSYGIEGGVCVLEGLELWGLSFGGGGGLGGGGLWFVEWNSLEMVISVRGIMYLEIRRSRYSADGD